MSLFCCGPRVHMPLAWAWEQRKEGGESKEDVCSQTPHANKINPTRLRRPPAERCQAICQQGHQPDLRTWGWDKYQGKRRNGVDLKPGAYRSSHQKAWPLATGLQLQNGQRANSKQWFPVNPKTLRATPPSSRHRLQAPSLLWLPFSTKLWPPREQCWAWTHVSFIQC